MLVLIFFPHSVKFHLLGERGHADDECECPLWTVVKKIGGGRSLGLFYIRLRGMFTVMVM